MDGSAEIQSIQDTRVSYATLSRAFGIARETVRSRLDRANVRPDGERRGFSVFPLADAARALVLAETPMVDGVIDPDKLPPFEAKAYWQAKQERIKAGEMAGDYVTSDDCRQQLVHIVTATVQMLDTLEDVLERDAAMKPTQLKVVAKVINLTRAQWAEKLDAA